jgi:hypothetical protein
MDRTLKKTIAASTTNPKGAPPWSRSVRQGGDFDFPTVAISDAECSTGRSSLLKRSDLGSSFEGTRRSAAPQSYRLTLAALAAEERPGAQMPFSVCNVERGHRDSEALSRHNFHQHLRSSYA